MICKNVYYITSCTITFIRIKKLSGSNQRGVLFPTLVSQSDGSGNPEGTLVLVRPQIMEQHGRNAGWGLSLVLWRRGANVYEVRTGYMQVQIKWPQVNLLKDWKKVQPCLTWWGDFWRGGNPELEAWHSANAGNHVTVPFRPAVTYARTTPEIVLQLFKKYHLAAHNIKMEPGQ